MDRDTQAIIDSMLLHALERGSPSVAKLQRASIEIASIDWEEYIADYNKREDTKKDRLESVK